MSNSKHWSDMAEAGALWGIRAMLFSFRLFGRRVFRVLLWPVIVYFYLRRRTARAASLDFLARVDAKDGRLPVRGWRGIARSFKHFLWFGEIALDKLAVWQQSFDGEVIMHGRQALLDNIAARRGAVLLVSHLGNTEVCQSLAEQLGAATVNVLVHTEHAQKFNSLLSAKEQAARVNLVPVTAVSPATAMMLEDKLAAGEFVAIAADRTPVPPEGAERGRQLPAQFLGETADFPQGPFVLAALLRRPVFFLCAVKTGRRYDIYVEPMAERIKMKRSDREASLLPYVQDYANRLARYARDYPLQWGNFYDFWRRD
ncbi:hypothetical protein [Simiduia aestuariiviva]|uniref:Putative LPLAT superfamily acyltransferase n=1 Tax=Simiduia aestuariiviva TaxID=1510459 RepID=A0A839UNE7_9GAMM|nr:hypothetical protein [Simiduia aestuariiviva]MBB3169253.1 putative LPLAT superfamily acyltransferase [Simiduia aestuariiviva]